MIESQREKSSEKMPQRIISKAKPVILPRPRGPIESLSATELRLKFSGEYHSWKNGKARAKTLWAPEFAKFRDFLRHMGPMPSKGCTLDRIDNDDRRYGPGLCRWADKKQQAANRSSTHRVNVGAAEPQPLPEVARVIGTSPAALRAQLKRRGELKFGADPRKHSPWPRSADGTRQIAFERAYLGSDAARSSTRYDYLIVTLSSTIEECLDYLDKNLDPTADEQDAEVSKQIKILNNAQAWLETAKKEKPLWEASVREYESMQFDKAKARKLGYLKRDPDPEQD